MNKPIDKEYLITLVSIKFGNNQTVACFTILGNGVNDYFEIQVGKSMKVMGKFYPHWDDEPEKPNFIRYEERK